MSEASQTAPMPHDTNVVDSSATPDVQMTAAPVSLDCFAEVQNEMDPQQDKMETDTDAQQDDMQTDTDAQKDKMQADTDAQQDEMQTDTDTQQDKMQTETEPEQDKMQIEIDPQQTDMRIEIDSQQAEVDPQQDEMETDPQQDKMQTDTDTQQDEMQIEIDPQQMDMRIEIDSQQAEVDPQQDEMETDPQQDKMQTDTDTQQDKMQTDTDPRQDEMKIEIDPQQADTAMDTDKPSRWAKHSSLPKFVATEIRRWHSSGVRTSDFVIRSIRQRINSLSKLVHKRDPSFDGSPVLIEQQSLIINVTQKVSPKADDTYPTPRVSQIRRFIRNRNLGVTTPDASIRHDSRPLSRAGSDKTFTTLASSRSYASPRNSRSDQQNTYIQVKVKNSFAIRHEAYQRRLTYLRRAMCAKWPACADSSYAACQCFLRAPGHRVVVRELSDEEVELASLAYVAERYLILQDDNDYHMG
ncbi:hypothetical protein BZA05DRAFT_459754 [Tricharina praecox]|uniref:uncharacterized protein n=1 Tax=Tricharina praecox TaxID=43433 RepID=UPI00221F4916|nr:uncharacterized protein BZA05DRAFT_459754 [Tricharina praecox]KAI5844800.1 hypothetical protein BZA05DRAFT_459754 [Tricharina praecox]